MARHNPRQAGPSSSKYVQLVRLGPRTPRTGSSKTETWSPCSRAVTETRRTATTRCAPSSTNSKARTAAPRPRPRPRWENDTFPRRSGSPRGAHAPASLSARLGPRRTATRRWGHDGHAGAVQVRLLYWTNGALGVHYGSPARAHACMHARSLAKPGDRNFLVGILHGGSIRSWSRADAGIFLYSALRGDASYIIARYGMSGVR
jgi:hypothetical protein